MPVVKGNLSDVGLGHLVGFVPEIRFILNEPNTAGVNVFATRPEVVTPASNGDFTVTLADTTLMGRSAWYEMSVRWQEPGTAFAQGYVPVDFHSSSRLVVPAEGGNVGDLILISAVAGNDLVYVSDTAIDSKVYSGFQLNAVTGDLYQRES